MIKITYVYEVNPAEIDLESSEIPLEWWCEWDERFCHEVDACLHRNYHGAAACRICDDMRVRFSAHDWDDADHTLDYNGPPAPATETERGNLREGQSGGKPENLHTPSGVCQLGQ